MQFVVDLCFLIKKKNYDPFQQPFQGVLDILCLQYINDVIQLGGRGDGGQRQIDDPVGVDVSHQSECGQQRDETDGHQ